MLRVVLLLAVVFSSASCLVWKNQWRHTVAVKVHDDIAYIDDGDDKHRLDVVAPSGATSSHPVPVVVFIHGGWWREGDRSYFEPIVGLYGNVGTALGDMGVVTVIPSYRLWPAVPSYVQQLDDIAAVVRWTKAHIASVGGDPSRIVLAGHSAGGHLVTMFANPEVLTSRALAAADVKGIVGISGIYDVRASADSDDAETQATFWTPYFGTPEQQIAASPLTTMMSPSSTVPLLFIVGSEDYRSCERDFKTTQARFAGNPRARFAAIAGNSHEDMVLEIGTADDEVAPRIAAFARLLATAEARP